MLPVRALLTRLARAYGAQHWWPAESPLEVIVGAVLVQRTTWRNAETAIANLRESRLLTCESLALVRQSTLETCIRSAGFYRTKAARLRAIAKYFSGIGGVDALARLETDVLRETLRALPGIGEETADAIVLYAYDRPVWVMDAYSRRLFARMAARAWSRPDERAYVGPLVRAGDTQNLKDLHALIVEHGKRCCLAEPRCGDCTLRARCAFGSRRFERRSSQSADRSALR